MRDHPKPSELDRLLFGELAPGELRAVLSHLLPGCPECQARLAPVAAALLSDAPWRHAAPVPTDSYDLAIDRAIEAVRQVGTNAWKIKAATEKAHARILEQGLDTGWKDLPEIAVFEALLQRAQELRNEDPAGMVRCAFLAMWSVRLMRELPPREHADVNARGLAEYASALRLSDQLGPASQYLDAADDALRSGTGDRSLALRLKDIRASLYGAQEHYTDAVELADEVATGRLQLGDRRGAATAMIQKAIFTGYAGDFGEELRLLEEAEALLASERDPAVDFALLSNKLYVLIELGRATEALGLLQEHKGELWATSSRIDRCRLLGIEGRIFTALGRWEQAEVVLGQSKQGFNEAGIFGHEALAGLYLATVILRRDRSRYFEAANLAVEALRTFSVIGVKPQIEEALLVLSDALQHGIVTATLLQSVADFVRRAEHNRRARYQPRFE